MLPSLALIVSVYISASIFLLHTLWLLLSGLFSRTPIWNIFQDVIVIPDGISMPHPPGFFDPFQTELKSNSFDDTSLSDDFDPSTSHDASSADSDPATGGLDGHEDQYLTTAALDLTALDANHPPDIFDSLHLTQEPVVISPSTAILHEDKAPPRSSRRKTNFLFRKPTSPPSPDLGNPPFFSRSMSLMFNQMSSTGSRAKEELKGEEKSSKMRSMFSTKLVSFKSTKLFKKDNNK